MIILLVPTILNMKATMLCLLKHILTIYKQIYDQPYLSSIINDYKTQGE